MQKLRKFLKQTYSHRDETGSSVLETVIAVPLMLIVVGMLAYGLVKSLTIMHDNSISVDAGNAAQKVVETLKDSKSCYDLKTALNNDSLFVSNSDYKITHSETECKANTPVTFTIKAERNSDSVVIFETTFKNFIQGSDYEPAAP